MEVKDVVVLVLGSNFIIAVATFFTTFLTTKMQVKSAGKQFEKQFEKELVTYHRERRREVRSEPLLKLSAELATMASKLEKLAKQGNSFTPINTEEQRLKDLEQFKNDWVKYVSEDHLERVLYSQFDMDLVNRVREIRNEYLDTYRMVVTYKTELSAVEFGKAASAAEEKIRPEVVGVQELIRKRLEEL